MGKELRIFLWTATILFAGLHSAETSETPSYPRVGILIPEAGRPQTRVIQGFQEELKALGYRDQENILVQVRDGKGDRGALKPAATELVSQKVDAIVTTGTRATLLAKTSTSEIPVVFVHPADPVALGFVKSMTHPEGNVTGVAGLSQQMTGKRIEILREIYPGVQRLLIFYDQNDAFSRDNFLATEKAAIHLRLKAVAHPVKTPEEFKVSLNSIQKREGDAVFHIPDNLVEGQVNYLFEVARQKRLPTMFHGEEWVIKGALAGYGPSYYQMGRQAARLVANILKGQKPRQLPVEQVKKFDLFINYRTGYLIDFIPSREILKRADKVIR